MNVHPAAELFPMMDDEQFKGLLEDIRENGLDECGVLTVDGQILDGRNRYKACQQLGIAMEWSQLEHDSDVDPFKYVISKNLHRRHLTYEQRVIIGAKMATMQHGGDRKSEEIKGPNGPLKIDDVAKAMDVSPMSVKRGKAVLEHGSDELVNAVESGEVSVSRAAEIAKTTPKAEQLPKAKEKKPPKPRKPKKPADPPKRVPKSAESQVDPKLERLYDTMDAISDKLVIARALFQSCTDPEKASVLLAWKEWMKAAGE